MFRWKWTCIQEVTGTKQSKRCEQSMKVIGITGGVGAGKSQVLEYLQDKYGATIIKTDDLGKKVQKKGTECFQAIVEHFGEDILNEKGELDRPKLADIVFSDEKELDMLNAIVHPAVKEEILRKLKGEERKSTNLVLIESAILNKVDYQSFCDEVWYIHTDEEIRIQRLMKNRGYTREKSLGIIGNQASEDYFRAHTDFVVENNGNVEKTWKQIDEGVRRNETL